MNPRTSLLALVVLCVSVAALALTAPSALAASAREYKAKIEPKSGGFEEPEDLTIDPADNVWVRLSPPGPRSPHVIAEYGPYPSQTQIGTQPDEAGRTRSGGGLAVNSANDSLYLTISGFGDVVVYNALGEFVPPQWELKPRGEYGSIELAIDNSGGESNGRVYVSRTFLSSSDTITALSPEEAAVNFSAHEEYITGNEITREPLSSLNAAFHDPVVDPLNGNLYVETAFTGINVFKPSGEFVESIPIGGEGDPMAFDPTNGNLLIDEGAIDEFSPSGEFLGQITGTSPSTPFVRPGQIAVNSEGYLYVVEQNEHVVDIFAPKVVVPKIHYPVVSNATPTSGNLNATIDPSEAGEKVTTCHFEYGTDLSFGLGSVPCLNSANVEVGTPTSPITSSTEVHAAISGLATDTTYYYRALAGNASATRPGTNQNFTPRAVQALHTEPATDVEATTATFHGSFLGNGEDTHYYFEYGTDTTYGSTTKPEEDAGEETGKVEVAPVSIVGLEPDGTYHFRIVARNAAGTTYGPDQTFTTLTKPSIDSFFTSNLTSTTAVLHATINPHGGDTTYHFEYGTTTSYGSSATGSEEEITSDLLVDHSVEVELTNLQAGVTYHFRVVAESKYGSAVSEDQTFGFYPPSCPNAHLRQITNASNLPDCRAYELVSPADANGTTLFPEGPNSSEETSPLRFAFGGFLGTIPGSGNPINNDGDLYVATRTDEGWVTKYVGLPANQALKVNGPPNEPSSGGILASPAGVRGNSRMNEFLDWNNGNQGSAGARPERNFTPHVWSADGSSLGEWPTAPGYSVQHSPELNQSADFTHFVFQIGEAPSLSLIDNNTVTNTASEVSKLPSGAPIPMQIGDTTPNFESLRIPAVSSDGSRILIAARMEPGEACSSRSLEMSIKCPLQPSQLYLRVDDLVTYEIASGHAVSYVGMTPDASKVYFTSAEQLTSEDHDTSTDLYMWSAEKEEQHERPLTLISKGVNSGEPGKPGNTDACNASWTPKCGVLPYANNAAYKDQDSLSYGSILGNGLSDNSIASTNGDIYFFSPEQLAGSKGVNGQENLYDYRNDRVQYVTTLTPQTFCVENLGVGEQFCSEGPALRMQVSSTDSYMAFLTASRVTSYNNAGLTEMYRYQPSTEQLICVSCRPNGEPPTTEVLASSDGLFMTDDGRTFFSTGDALVPQDTDGLRDVYEFVEGHAQLISSGTSSKDRVVGRGIAAGQNNELFIAGLVGVTGNGINAYFSTYDTLVGQDHNGSQLKFYDAHTDGGFPYLAPSPPCEAADECHGPGSSPEAAAQNGTGAVLGPGGNLTPSPSDVHKHHKKKHHKKHHKKHTRKHG